MAKKEASEDMDILHGRYCIFSIEYPRPRLTDDSPFGDKFIVYNSIQYSGVVLEDGRAFSDDQLERIGFMLYQRKRKGSGEPLKKSKLEEIAIEKGARIIAKPFGRFPGLKNVRSQYLLFKAPKGKDLTETEKGKVRTHKG